MAEDRPRGGLSSDGFWRGRRVLVTGHTGFKGGWLCLLLDALGADVHGYALVPPTQPSLYALARVDELVDSKIGDIREFEALAAHVRAIAPDVVIHMAAQSVVLRSYDDPRETYSSNVLGTVNVLEALRKCGRGCAIVNVTTDKCYENKDWVWGYRESDGLGGRDPYSSSKACAELVAGSYRDSFFPPERWHEHRFGLASARAGNVIGGGDWTERQLIPEAVAAFAVRQPVRLRHPEAIRPWQHVLDCLAGYLMLAEALSRDAPAFAGGWNFGPRDDEARPVSYVVERIADHWSVDPSWLADERDHAHEERQLRLDVTKSAELLGWRCRLTLDEALRWTSKWYREWHGGADARRLCREQIDRFLDASDAAR